MLAGQAMAQRLDLGAGAQVGIGVNAAAAQVSTDARVILPARVEAAGAHCARSMRPRASKAGMVIGSLAALAAIGCEAKRATTMSAFGAT